MSYMDKYNERASAYGNGISGTYKNSTINLVNDKFTYSPFYRNDVLVNGTATEVILGDIDLQVRNEAAEGMMFDSKILHFRPGVTQNLGSLVSFDGYNYLIIDFNANPIYPKARLLKCNNTLFLNTSDTKTQVGTDPMNRPIYQDNPSYTNYPCITQDIASLPPLTQGINIPTGQIRARIQYNPNVTIKEGMKFNINNKGYEIIGLTFDQVINNVGILGIVGEKVV